MLQCCKTCAVVTQLFRSYEEKKNRQLAQSHVLDCGAAFKNQQVLSNVLVEVGFQEDPGGLVGSASGFPFERSNPGPVIRVSEAVNLFDLDFGFCFFEEGFYPGDC